MKKVRTKKNILRIKIDKLITGNISSDIFWYFIFNTTWYGGFDNHEDLCDMTSINIKRQLQKHNKNIQNGNN